MDKFKEDKVKSIIKYNKILYHSQFQYHSFIYRLYIIFYPQNYTDSVHHLLILSHILVYHFMTKVPLIVIVAIKSYQHIVMRNQLLLKIHTTVIVTRY